VEDSTNSLKEFSFCLCYQLYSKHKIGNVADQNGTSG
jgi:hypothetical protein